MIRRIEITLQVTVIVIEHLRLVGNKIARAVFDRLNTTDNDILEIMDPVIFSRVIVDDTVNIALLVKFVALDTAKLGTLLPGKVVPPHEVRQAFWINQV